MILEEEPLDLAGFLRRNLLWMVLFALVAGGAMAGWVLSKPRLFQSHSSVFVLGPSLPVVPDVVRDSLDLYRGLDNLESYLVSLLRSQSLRLSVARRLKLADSSPFWAGVSSDSRNTQDLLLQMERLLTVESRRGLVSVAARTVNPELSRSMAQACLEELTSRLAARDTQRRDFLAKQLELSRERLRKSEDALRRYQESSGTLIPQEQQSTQEFAVLVDLGRELATAEVSLLSVERQLDAPGDIEKMQELESKRAGLSAQVERLQEMVASREESLRGVPGVAAQYIRLQRDVKVNEKVYELLTEQFPDRPHRGGAAGVPLPRRGPGDAAGQPGAAAVGTAHPAGGAGGVVGRDDPGVPEGVDEGGEGLSRDSAQAIASSSPTPWVPVRIAH